MVEAAGIGQFEIRGVSDLVLPRITPTVSRRKYPRSTFGPGSFTEVPVIIREPARGDVTSSRPRARYGGPGYARTMHRSDLPGSARPRAEGVDSPRVRLPRNLEIPSRVRGRILSLSGRLGAPVFWVASLERDKARLSSRQERDHESVHLSGFVVLNPVGRISDMEHLAALTKGNARLGDS